MLHKILFKLTYILPHHTGLHFFLSPFNVLSLFLSVFAYLELDFQWCLLLSSPSERKSFQGSKASVFSFSVFSNALLVNPSQNKIRRIPWNGLFFSRTLKEAVHIRLNKAIDKSSLKLAVEKLLDKYIYICIHSKTPII